MSDLTPEERAKKIWYFFTLKRYPPTRLFAEHVIEFDIREAVEAERDRVELQDIREGCIANDVGEHCCESGHWPTRWIRRSTGELLTWSHEFGDDEFEICQSRHIWERRYQRGKGEA